LLLGRDLRGRNVRDPLSGTVLPWSEE